MEGVCHHVYGDTLMAAKHTFGFFRECGLCDVRRQYSRMSQCPKCKVYFHKRCFFAELRKQDMEGKDKGKIKETRYSKVGDGVEKQRNKTPKDDCWSYGSQSIIDLLSILMTPASAKALKTGVARVDTAVGDGVTEMPPNGQKSDILAPFHSSAGIFARSREVDHLGRSVSDSTQENVSSGDLQPPTSDPSVVCATDHKAPDTIDGEITEITTLINSTEPSQVSSLGGEDFETGDPSNISGPAIQTMEMRNQRQDMKSAGDESTTRVRYFTGLCDRPVIYYDDDLSWIDKDEKIYRHVIENYPILSYFEDEHGEPFLREIKTGLFTLVEAVDIAEIRASQYTPCTIQELLEISE